MAGDLSHGTGGPGMGHIYQSQALIHEEVPIPMGYQ